MKEAITAEDLVDFINHLPVDFSIEQWIRSFKESLKHLLGDVDNITVYIDLQCKLIDPGEFGTSVMYIEHSPAPGAAPVLAVHELSPGEAPSALILEDLRRQGHPLGAYREPVCRDYFVQGDRHLGTLIFWRSKKKSPISADTLEYIGTLKPFFEFLLSDAVTRNNYRRPIDRQAISWLEAKFASVPLTDGERAAITLIARGQSYSEAAKTLSITPAAIKKRIHQVLIKTGARSTHELVIPPHIEIDKSDSPDK